MLISFAALLFRISLVIFRKTIASETGQIPQNISFNEQFQESFRLGA